MAKPKSPKKNTDLNQTVPNTSNPPQSNPDPAAAEITAAAAAASEARSTVVKNAASRKTRKPEIVKPEPRTNLVPINLEDEIRRLAYLMSERRGFEAGHETEDWLAAEREVLQRYRQHSA